MRVLAILLGIAVLAYILAGVPRRYSRRQRFRFALAVYIIAFLGLIVLIAVNGNRL